MTATLTPNPDYGSTSTDISPKSNCHQTTGAPRQFGYARVSTYDQDLSLQIEALTKHGIPKPCIFMDKASGAKTERPGLTKCLETLQTGDVLVVWRLDRLGRSMRHLITLVEDLRTRGIGFRSLNPDYSRIRESLSLHSHLRC